MISFMNERSLEQYGDLGASLSFFLSAARELSGAGASLFKDSRFFASANFLMRFNALSLAKDQRALIRELAFSSKYFRCWIQERVSLEADPYRCANPIVDLRDESLGEAAERGLAGMEEQVSILSASDSVFRNSNTLRVSKVSSGQTVELDNATSIQVVRHWIVSRRGNYNPNSQAAPHDFQTVLVKDSGRFRQTNRVERRFARRIFEEISTSRLYYVDDGHAGASAHLEVFSPNCLHLGTADIDSGELNTKGRVEGRTLRT